MHVIDRPVHSIFIGGGTPSLLSGQSIERLLQGIKRLVHVDPAVEITLEANPGTIDSDHFAHYQQAGINRLSIGVQSLHDTALMRLGRIHSAKQAISAIKHAQQLNLRSLNVDLMHGLPDQSLEEALADLKQIVLLAPPHLSWYQLTIEPQTLFGSNPPVLPDEEILWQIYQQGHELLISAGYQQYEISGYAKLGHQCQHNLNYWRFGDYLAIGCGAHGKITAANNTLIRFENTRHPKGYLQGHYQVKQYIVPIEERPFEFFMNHFRLLEPCLKMEFEKRTGLPESIIRTSLDQAITQQYIEETATSWQVTPKGMLFLNSLLELFLH